MSAAFIDFRHVKQEASFGTLLAFYGLKSEGKGPQRTILCPFHDERTPSCKVNLEKGVFHCFGCGAKGNILEFVAKKEGLDLRSAALRICETCHIDPAPAQPAGSGASDTPAKAHRRPQDARKGSETAQEAPKASKPVLEPPSASGAKPPPATPLKPLSFTLQLDPSHPYLRERGLDPQEVETFGIGYCSRGVMKGRIAIPLHDEAGNLVAYAGRWPGEPPEGEPKYRLPDGFEKTRILFNLNRVPVGEEAVLVEGFFASIALATVGVWASAVMGSALAESQAALLRSRGVRQLVVVFDGDAAGQEAAKKVAAEWSASFAVRRVVLPEGSDPDTSIREALKAGGPLPAWLEHLRAS